MSIEVNDMAGGQSDHEEAIALPPTSAFDHWLGEARPATPTPAAVRATLPAVTETAFTPGQGIPRSFVTDSGEIVTGMQYFDRSGQAVFTLDQDPPLQTAQRSESQTRLNPQDNQQASWDHIPDAKIRVEVGGLQVIYDEEGRQMPNTGSYLAGTFLQDIGAVLRGARTVPERSGQRSFGYSEPDYTESGRRSRRTPLMPNQGARELAGHSEHEKSAYRPPIGYIGRVAANADILKLGRGAGIGLAGWLAFGLGFTGIHTVVDVASNVSTPIHVMSAGVIPKFGHDRLSWTENSRGRNLWLAASWPLQFGSTALSEVGVK